MNDNRIDAFVESRMRGNAHVRFGGRRRGNHQRKRLLGASPSTLLRMYFGDHPPPHFHVRYGEHKARCSIATGEVIDGELPARAARLVREWASLHVPELEENWRRCEQRLPLSQVEPLP